MTDKVVRDELLRSHRYQSLSSDTAKLLFLHLLLASDYLSNAEATATAVSIIMGRTITEEATASLLDELADRDLVRPYIDDKKTYVHIPRSRQRIRYIRGKHPRPPENIEDIGIRELIAKVGLQSDRSQTTVSLQYGKSEAKRSKTKAPPVRFAKPQNAPRVPPGFDRFWQAWPPNKRKVNRKGTLARWLTQHCEAVIDTILVHLEALKRTEQWRKDNGEYIPSPETYVNQRRWEDGTPEAKPDKRKLAL